MHTLFRSQVIHGVLLDAINSDSPSQVRVKVTRPVMDKFQVGEVLIPQHAIILGQAEGSPNFGQARMNVTLDEIEYPNGTLLNLTKQKLGDQSGAGGLGATVNNHYLQVGIGAVLSAFLSVGARSFGGTGGGAFQSSPELELSRNVSGQFNQTGQDVIRRELMRAPTLTVPAGTAVTLSLTENLSLSRPPVPQR
jgi:type IV secretory pathway VirB10-like protein